MTGKEARTQIWINLSKHLRFMKSSQNGFENAHTRSEALDRLFARLRDSVADCLLTHELCEQIMALGSLEILEVSLEAHGVGAWKQTVRAAALTIPAKAGNLALLARLGDLKFDLSSPSRHILLAAAQRDDPELLDWWMKTLSAGADAPGYRKVIEACGPKCASVLHRYLARALDPATTDAGKALLEQALMKSNLKAAAYLRAIGVRIADLPAWASNPASMPDFALPMLIRERLARMEGSAHAELAFLRAEPDPVAILGRPKHESFAGLDAARLFDAALG